MTKNECLRIGVSGHRFLAEVDRIRQSVDSGIQRLEESFSDRALHVYASLAEGADRIVAERVLCSPGSKLTAVLPMPKSAYLEDFTSSASRQHFETLLAKATETIELAQRGTREECYAAAGEFVLLSSDILFALWDGREAQGKGGT